LQHVLRDVLA